MFIRLFKVIISSLWWNPLRGKEKFWEKNSKRTFHSSTYISILNIVVKAAVYFVKCRFQKVWFKRKMNMKGSKRIQFNDDTLERKRWVKWKTKNIKYKNWNPYFTSRRTEFWMFEKNILNLEHAIFHIPCLKKKTIYGHSRGFWLNNNFVPEWISSLHDKIRQEEKKNPQTKFWGEKTKKNFSFFDLYIYSKYIK